MKKIPLLVLISVMVLIGGYLVLHKKSISTQGTHKDTVSVLPPNMAGGASGQFARIASNAIHVTDQYPGGEVYVNFVNIEEPGFVIITKVNNLNQENIIGLSAWLTAGYHQGISILTTEKMIGNSDYFAWIVSDDGDGIFDPKHDKVVDFNKTAVMSEFRALEEAIDPKSIEINF